MSVGYSWFANHQEWILAVTKALNAMPPGPDGYYLQVKMLTEEGTPMGEWSDEIASTDWSFSEIHP